MSLPLPKNVTALQKPTAAVVHITPEMAERWLGRNEVNRNIRNKKIDVYARDMASGNWQLTGEAIKFDHAGKLIDGQHRCAAIIKSGCTIPMFVVRNLSPDAQPVMDSGSARLASDNLSMSGYKNAVAVASVARRMMAFVEKRDPKQITNSEVYAFVDEHPEIAFAARIGTKFGTPCDIAPGYLGVAAWLIAEFHGWEVAESFFYTAAEKIGLTRHDPITAMTKFFAEARRDRKQVPMEIQLSVILRAFNLRLRGKTIQFLRPEVNGIPVPIPSVATL